MRSTVAAVAAIAVVVATALPGVAGDAETRDLTVQQSTYAVSASVGQRFSFQSTVTNTAPSTATDLVAHLNIVSLDPNVYVDPEDWSSHRTQYLAPLGPSRAALLQWTVHAVNNGHFILYVTLLTPAAAEPVAAGRALRADVTRSGSLSTRGALPVTVIVPASVLVLFLGSVVWRRRRA
jgi:hypothetical protein